MTQVRAFGAFTGRGYGAFAGKGAEDHPVARIAQGRAFGAFAGTRYGSFEGRSETAPQVPVRLGGWTIDLPRPLRDELRHRRIDEDDLLLLMAACLDGNALLQ